MFIIPKYKNTQRLLQKPYKKIMTLLFMIKFWDRFKKWSGLKLVNVLNRRSRGAARYFTRNIKTPGH